MQWINPQERRNDAEKKLRLTKVEAVFKPSFERKASINDVRHSRSAE
jgi:hypothetical protein